MKTKKLSLVSISIGIRWLLIVCGLLGTQSLFAAVTFTNLPTAVSNTYNGTISLQIGGLTNGETVMVQKFLDLNTNGVIDASDYLVQQFNLTDGTNFVIAGVTNFNVPGDLNATTGAITATLNFQNGDFVQNIAGKFLYKLSSPSGHFTPITNVFTVTNFPFAQKISGNVVNTGTNVPNAVVVIFPAASGGNGPGTPVGGTVANNSGAYTIQLPPGSYVPMAFCSNYVANYSASPAITLGSSQTIATNLTLTNATATISGQFVDTNNSAIKLPGIFCPVTAQINNQAYIVVCFSGTNGSFSARVISGQWKLGSDDSALTVHGYVGYEDGTNVSSGTTGITLAYTKATALFYGRVTDASGNPLANIDIGTYDNNNNIYQADANTDTNGNYTVGVLGGLGSSDGWWVGFNGDSSTYIFSQPDFDQNGGTNLNAGQAVLVNFTGVVATNLISGNVQYNGSPVTNLNVYANATIGGANFTVNANTDDNGDYSFNVANGNWSVGLNCQGGDQSLDGILGSGNYQCPGSDNITIANDNGTADFTVQPCDGIQLITASLLPGGQVGNAYYIQLQASSCSGSLTWGLNDQADFPPGLSFYSDGEIMGTPDTGGTYNFSVNVNDGENVTNFNLSLTINAASNPLQVTTTSLPNGNAGVTYSTQLTATGGQSPYNWSLASGSQALPAVLTLSTNGVISGIPATNGLFSFIVQVTDANLNSADQSLGLILNPKPQLSSTAKISSTQFQFQLTGAANQNYTLQISTNLSSANWTSLFTTNSATSGSFLITDPNATNQQRFYRVLIGP